MYKKAYPLLIFIVSTFILSSCAVIDELYKDDISSDKPYDNESHYDVIDGGPIRGGTLNLFSTEPDTLNPILTKNRFVSEFLNLVFEGLVAIDEEQEPVPLLVSGWEVSNDGLTWDFKIRENVFWHDNLPLSADDVEFTFMVILNDRSESVYKNNLENITSYSAVEEKLFRVVLKEPDSFTAQRFTFPILPKHLFIGEDIFNTQRNYNPCGTGPYKFKEYINGETVVLTANDNWWKKEFSEGQKITLPLIPMINVKLYKEEEQRHDAIQSGEIDYCWFETKNTLITGAKKDLTEKVFPSRYFEYVAFNINRGLFKDLAVRQAISCLLNREKIIKDLLPQKAIPANIPIVSNSWIDSYSEIYFHNDVIMAEKILENSDWIKGENGYYSNRWGVYRTLKFNLLVNEENDIRLKVAQAISEQLHEYGITVNIKEVKWEELNRLVKNRQFDAVLLGCRLPQVPDISFMYSSEEIDTGNNIAGYSNESMDRYLNEIKINNDIEVRKKMFESINETVQFDAPYIGLYLYNDIVLINNRIRGEIRPHTWNRYNDITRWYMPIR